MMSQTDVIKHMAIGSKDLPLKTQLDPLTLSTSAPDLGHFVTYIHTYICRGNLMSVHWASQITSEKLAILDRNRFIKSTTNWYPEVSKEPFYCIL